MDILNLQENAIILIDKNKYIILNKVKFVEKSSFWYEYKLQKMDDLKEYYLNVELNKKVILYEILYNINIDIKMSIEFNNEVYELYEKGQGKIETYFGCTDVGIDENVKYYEYVNNKNNKIISIEKWKDETEVSIGEEINLKRIKIIS